MHKAANVDDHFMDAFRYAVDGFLRDAEIKHREMVKVLHPDWTDEQIDAHIELHAPTIAARLRSDTITIMGNPPRILPGAWVVPDDDLDEIIYPESAPAPSRWARFKKWLRR